MKRIFIIFALLITPLFLPLNVQAALSHNLYYGMTYNAEVKEMQQFLIDKGFYTGRATGNFGSLTSVAVKKYQKSIGLNGTGLVGALTRTAINRAELLAGGQANIPPVIPPVVPPVVQGTPVALISYPTVGLNLTKEKTYVITWTTQNLSAAQVGNIKLYPGDPNQVNPILITTIANNVLMSTGQYSWTIPGNETIYEGQYYIGISLPINGQNYFFNSEAFTIKESQPQITVTAPGSGADLVNGRKYTITWTSQDISAATTATISLYSNSSSAQSLLVVANNVLVSGGKLDWMVPNDLLGQYKINITTNNGINGDSGVFNISAASPKITVNSPVAGATLYKGQTYDINWTYQDIPDSTLINVYLCRNMGTIGATLNSIITAIPVSPLISAGKVSWTIPDTANIFASQYIIYIVTTDGNFRGWSDSFKIKVAGEL